MLFLNRRIGDRACACGPSNLVDDPAHGSPQRRVGVHHPTHGMAVRLIPHDVPDLGGADAGRVKSNAGAELRDDLPHGPHVRALVPLGAHLQNLGGRVGLVPHVHGRAEAKFEELCQSEVNDDGSVCTVLHLEDK